MIPTPWRWAFPPCTAHTGNPFIQVHRIEEEAREALEALMDGDALHAAEEAMDTIHACETLLRMLEPQGVDLDAVKRGVVEKNDERGYYEKKLKE